jgi:tRNA pseudouridine32 synthase/23S rRNA pseudouridine746 synthase
MFQKRVIDKEYEALAPRLHEVQFPFTYRSRMVEGDKFFVMKEAEGEPNSETLIDVIEHRGELTLYRLHPHTGRQHQLRVHLSSLGIPIVNDAFYPVALPCKQDDVSQPLQLLARAISFIDPLSGDWREFRSQRSL